MKKWDQIYKGRKLSKDEIIDTLLLQRGIKTKREKEEFLNPKLENITPKNLGIDPAELSKTKKRIKKAIKSKEKIIVYGDYDVDGVTGTAILWETLNKIGADVMPYIPNRVEEGYGLSIKGIESLISQEKVDLIITVDNGIVATDAVDFANKNGIDVIITDHHSLATKKPKAFSIVHTTKICGAAVAYVLSQEFDGTNTSHLELVCLATIADLVPLSGASRTYVKFGLEELRHTKRVGLIALFNKAVVKKEEIGVYEIGHIIAPRINAMGRLADAMDSLRLICTKDPKRADGLSFKLSNTNKERQGLTEESVSHARSKVNGKSSLLFVAHESYQQGIIGLIAGRLTEEFYRPSIVISKGKTYSKASARSIKGFNIIDFIRLSSDLLVDAGGHPMAAGFTVETSKLELLEKRMTDKAKELLKDEILEKTIRIDLEADLPSLSFDLFNKIQTLSPFGMGNPEPVFVTKGLVVEEIRIVGNGRKHTKLRVSDRKSRINMNGIFFGLEKPDFKVGDSLNIVYNLNKNEWNGTKSLQIKLRDIQVLPS